MSQARRRSRSATAHSRAEPPSSDWLWLKSLNLDLGGSALTGLRTGQNGSANGTDGRSLSLSFDRLGLVASPFNCLDSPVHVELAAEDVRLLANRNGKAHSFSIDLKDGRLIFEINRVDLEVLVQTLANEALRPEGIEISAVKLEFESLDRRTLKIQSRLTAKKRFVSTTLEGSGVLVVNDALQAKLNDFQLRGDGVVASLVARFLRPQLEAFTRTEVSLGIALLGCLWLTDIELHASEKLRVVAHFGSDQKRTRRFAPGHGRRQFHVYIIDTGSNSEMRRLLDESRARYATQLEKHIVYELTPGQSAALLQAHPDLVGGDPIVLAVDRAAAADKRSTGLGFRYNMGAVVDRGQAQRMLLKLFQILGEQDKADDITAAIRRHARKEGFRGTLDILDAKLLGFGGN